MESIKGIRWHPVSPAQGLFSCSYLLSSFHNYFFYFIFLIYKYTVLLSILRQENIFWLNHAFSLPPLLPFETKAWKKICAYRLHLLSSCYLLKRKLFSQDVMLTTALKPHLSRLPVTSILLNPMINFQFSSYSTSEQHLT